MSQHKVIDFFSGKPLDDLSQERIIRISPEHDGLQMLYSTENNPDNLHSMNILCWGLRWNGDVVGMVPWQDTVRACTDINDPVHGCWEGYYDSAADHVFYEAPMHKVVELETAYAYFESHLVEEDDVILQEIADNIGTHAMLMSEEQQSLFLTEVLSWRLYNNGRLTAMLVDPDKMTDTPVLVGDKCLYEADSSDQFRYFFQYHMANQIKNQDPETMKTIALLLKN